MTLVSKEIERQNNECVNAVRLARAYSALIGSLQIKRVDAYTTLDLYATQKENEEIINKLYTDDPLMMGEILLIETKCAEMGEHLRTLRQKIIDELNEVFIDKTRKPDAELIKANAVLNIDNQLKKVPWR